MAKQNSSIVLIIMMLISPIVAAFDNCSGMYMPGHQSQNQSLTDIMSTEDISPLKHKKLFKGQQGNQNDMSCHTSNSCTFHACGGYGMTSSAPSVNTIISLYYFDFEYISPYSTSLSLDLRPPILIL